LFSEISEAIVAAAAARDYIVLIDHTGGDRTHEARVANGLRPLTIDGVILGAVALRSEDLGAQPQGPPVVLLGHQPPGTQFDRVNSDDYTGARLATEHLISCGRRRIGAIRFWRDETDVVSALRHNGYRDALNAAGLEVKPNRIVTAPPECYHRRDGAYAMQQLLQRDPSIDAVFCFNDPMALGAMKTLHAADRRVPEDVAVVGYDDIEDGHYTTPSLTTVSVSAHETGRRAVSLLLDRIEGTSSTFPRHESVPVSVIARQSTTGSQAPDLLLEA
jgi:DNA-binding LacI/PurR family transcriptional regulator